MKKNTILLITGLIITLLFLVFSTKIFESLYYEREFSNEMYNQNLYFVVAIVTAIIAWVAAGIFYYAINSVSFSRWYHWLTVLGVAVILSAVVNYIYPNNIFSGDGLDFSAQLFSFCVVNVAVEAVLFIVASFSMRWWSSNCRHTPIPE
jgi:Na+-driven multidrug efflux pump